MEAELAAEFHSIKTFSTLSPLPRFSRALRDTQNAHRGGKLYDTVATFHLSNGSRLERINAFGNVRPYGIEASFGVTVNYRYLPAELEENHEQLVRLGRIRVSSDLLREHKAVLAAWQGPSGANRK